MAVPPAVPQQHHMKLPSQQHFHQQSLQQQQSQQTLSQQNQSQRQIVRSDGRVVVLPPIEKPATRSSKRKQEVDTPGPVHKE